MSGFALYEISGEYLSALESLTADDDMPADAIQDTLEGIEGEWQEKALNVARYIRNLEAEAEATDQAAKAMIERKKAASNKASRLRDYLLSEIERTGLTAKGADIEVKKQKNPEAVIIDSEEDIPCFYRTEKVVMSIDKTLIKKAIKDGFEVSGAHLAQSSRLVIK